MRQIYTRQAKSFLAVDVGLYKRSPPAQMIPYMVRASGVIRSTSMQNRGPAINLVCESMRDAWANIHRAMRPYFFTDIGSLFESYVTQGEGPIDLPNLEEMGHIHPSMHYCFDVLEDLDRVTAFLQNDPNAVDVSETVFNCWIGIARATSRLDGIERRIKSGKAFNGTV